MASTNQGAPSGAGDVSPTENGTGHSTNPKMRKRTKTGCLTCRKRRIKCGEERPTCGNCIKSKRQCEGYNQRVVFKTPLGEWPNHPGVVSELPYHSSMLPGTRNPGYRGGPPTAQPQDNTLTSIRPRPLTNFDFSNVETGPIPGLDPLNTQGLVGGPRPYDRDLSYPHPLRSPHHQQPLHSPQHQLPTPTSTTSYFPHQSPAHASFPAHFTHEANVGYAGHRYTQDQYPQTPVSYDVHVDQKPALAQAPQEHLLYQHQQSASHSPEEQSIHQIHSIQPSRAEEYPQYAAQRPSLNRYGSSPQVQSQQPRVGALDMSQAGSYAMPPAVSHTDFNLSSFRGVQIPSHDVDSDVKYVPQHAVLEQPIAVSLTQQNQPQLLLSGFGGDDHVSPTQVLDEAAIECEDDDYYDVQSDEEMMDREDEQEEDMAVLSQDYSLIRRIHFENTSELSVRRYDAFIYDGFLTHYKAENVANPLKNPKTARVFAHFIHITGPSLSIYERNPRSPNAIFDRTTPPGLQSLWTDILPMKALNHQGLLHAMLALASLHIARLQGASVTPSYKHYAYALKRLGRSLGNPKKRLTTQTLATSLLLAFYEVMTAEHVKWSTHLVGSAYLLSELDFRSLTREARRLKAEQTAQEEQFPYQNPDMLIDQRQFEQKMKESAMIPDETMVSTIVGKKVNYDDFGSVFEEGYTRHERKRPAPGDFDLHNYETLQDLYWWYARHDAFQSMVSGNPLIMAYRKWSDCPPRAPLGRGDALYGSHDHIILLIARIADFTVRDRERKLRQVDANGGQWRPTQVTDLFCRIPGMGPPPQGEGQNRPPPTPTTPMGPLPHMQGMGPPPDFMPAQGQGPPPGPPGPPTGPPRGPPPAGSMPNFYGMAPTRPPISLPASYVNPNRMSGGNSPPTPNMPHPKFSDLPAAYEAALADWNSVSHAHATVARFLANSEAFAPMTPDLLPPVPGGNMTPFGPALMHRSYGVSILWTLLHLSNILLLRSHPAMPPAAMVAAAVCAPATQPYAILIGRIAAGMQIPATSLTPSLGAALIESTMSLFFAGIQYKEPSQRDWLITRLLEIDRRTGWASAGVIARSCETSWERAADVGRGPPYDRRRTRRFGEEGPIVLDPNLGASRGQDAFGGSGAVGNISAIREHVELGWTTERQLWEADGRERRFVVKYKTGMVPWAMNLLGTDEDLRVGMENVGIKGDVNVAETEMEGGIDREYN